MKLCLENKKILESSAALQADLGIKYSKKETGFKVWAPSQDKVSLCLYKGESADPFTEISMIKQDGIFGVSLPGDWDGVFYSYKVGDVEVTDPYSIAASINSKRSAVVDLRSTDPEGFRDSYFMGKPLKDAIIYEVHVGDFMFDESADSSYPGKYLSFTEKGTNFHGYSTGIDHLKKLGISHVHLMPVSDFITVDESPDRFGDDDNYNWGYDPELFNVPEGSYSTDARDPKSRIRELKKLIMALHEAGIGVIVDVVYNHTYKTLDSNFNKLVPNYYYRQVNNYFSNGSGCGNELASEKPMVRKFIIESLLYWQSEYKVDGFRFDLMALMDIDTASLAYRELKARNPNIIFYGEPWGACDIALPWEFQTRWSSQKKIGFALFNERFRTAIKGDNDGYSRGYIQGINEFKSEIETGLLGSINYKGKRDGGVDAPSQSINYFNAHDNLILEDKLSRCMGDSKMNEAMSRLAFGVILTAQGVPFFHAGNEFRRSKHMDSNSYHSPYFVNAIDWVDKQENYDLYRYVRDLISIRNEFPSFRLASKEEIEKRIDLLDTGHPDVIALLHRDPEDKDKAMICFYHSGWESIIINDDFVFDAMDAMRFNMQKIFDNGGRIEVNKIDLSKANKVDIYLDPLSVTIYKLQKVL